VNSFRGDDATVLAATGGGRLNSSVTRFNVTHLEM
jgi:hypothetical protein